MTDVTVVVGAQFGSEGKGAITAHLAKTLGPADTVIRVAGPNAGHTAYSPGGREWKLRQVPVAAVVNDHCQLHLAAGSEIDLEVLLDEIAQLEMAGIPVKNRLTVHPSATVILDEHKAMESQAGLIGRVGSTGKGIGAARAARLMRAAITFGEFSSENRGWSLTEAILGEGGPFEIKGTPGEQIVIEGTQGYGLGLHTRFYPQVTSSDCRNVDFIAMSGVPVFDDRIDQVKTILVARVYPIRVAGNSGPLKDETSWAELGLPVERTTVTNNERRVGGWDEELVREALAANGGVDFNPNVVVALTMLDQRFPEIAGRTDFDMGEWGEARSFVDKLESDLEAYIEFVGTSPTTVVEP